MKKFILIGLFIALAVAIFLSPFASQHPDGLEKVAEDKAFLHQAEDKELFSAPIPDYSVPGINHQTVAGSLAGLIGTLATFLLAIGIGYCIKSRRNGKSKNIPQTNL